MQLRNPAILKKPLSAKHAAKVCETLRTNPSWEFGDYESEIGGSLWRWAEDSTTGFRHIIDARLALTLRHHGVTHFATANVADFVGFDFVKVWNPLLADPP